MNDDAGKPSFLGKSNHARLVRAVRDRQVILLYSNATRSIPFNIAIPLMLVPLVYEVVQLDHFVFWCGVMFVLSIIRLVHVRRMQKQFLTGGVPANALFQFGAGSTATGLLWGLGYVLFNGSLGVQLDMIFLWAMGGLAAGAFTSMASHHRVYVLFLMAMFIPVLAVVLMGVTQLSAAMYLLLLMFVSSLLIGHRIAVANLTTGIRNTLEKEELVLQLRDQSKKQQFLLENINGIRWEMELSTLRFMYVSPNVKRILGYSVDEWVDMDSWVAMVVPDDREYAKTQCMTETLAERDHVFEYRMKKMNGDVIWVLDVVTVINDDAGKPEKLEGFIMDITERKQAEDAIHDSEERYRSVFEGAPEGVWLIGPGRSTIKVNKRLCDMLGYQDTEIIGKLPMDFVDDENRKIFIEQTGKIETTDRREYEIELRHKDGHNIPCLFSATTLHTSHGGVLAAVAFVTDLSEQKVAEKALRRAQKMEAIGQLTGGIAHDFNNILSIILGNLDLLEQQMMAADSKSHKRVETIKHSAQRATDLTKQLLGFSRTKAGQTVITDINKVIRGMDSMIVRSVTPEVDIERHFTQNLKLTEIDPGDFQDALVNLVINARDAMPNGGQLVMETNNTTLDDEYCAMHPNSNACPGDYVELVISDSGEGIADELLDHIFEPFFTTKPQGKGTGLGLSMVFGFIQRSKGHIDVASEAGVGTTFRLYLPQATGNEHTSEITNEQPEALPGGRETLLIVDDEEALLELAEETLRSLGYRVLTIGNGKQALEILADDPAIDLLFSDVVMPGGINGYELAERAAAERPEIKILLTSGYTEKVVARDSQAHFSANLLSKPYRQAELAKRVRKILDESV